MTGKDQEKDSDRRGPIGMTTIGRTRSASKFSLSFIVKPGETSNREREAVDKRKIEAIKGELIFFFFPSLYVCLISDLYDSWEILQLSKYN